MRNENGAPTFFAALCNLNEIARLAAPEKKSRDNERPAVRAQWSARERDACAECLELLLSTS